MGLKLELPWSIITNVRVMGEHLKQLATLSLLLPEASKMSGKDRS